MNRIRIRSGLLSTFLALSLLLTACELPETPTPWPTHTPRPTSTPTPTQTPTPTLTPTVTPVVAVRGGTPVPDSGLKLTGETISRLDLLAKWGQGIPQQVHWSPDGSLVAVAATGGLFLYRSSDLALERRIEPGPALRSLAFSSDGSVVACGTDSGAILRWKVQDGSPLPPLQGTGSPVLSLQFSPDGSLLATSTWDDLPRLWRVKDGSLLVALADQLAPVRTIGFSPDGSEFFTWNRASQGKTWRTTDGSSHRELYTGVNSPGSTAAFSVDGQYLVVEQESRVKAFRTKDGTTLSSIAAGFSAPILATAISSGGKTIATLEAGTLRFWDGPSGRALGSLPLNTLSSGMQMEFSPAGDRLAVLGSGLQVFAVGNLPPATGTQPLTAPADFQVGSPLLSRFDDADFVEALDSGALHLYPQAGGSSILNLPGGGTVNSLALSADRKRAALAQSDNSLALVGISASGAVDGSSLMVLKGHRKAVGALAFSPDGQQLASGSADRGLRLWDASTGAVLQKLDLNLPVSGLVYSPDGKWLAVETGAGTQIFDPFAWKAIQELKGQGPLFSPKGDLLALLTVMGQARPAVSLLAVPGFQVLHTFAVDGSQLAFSPDGSLLAVSGPGLAFYETSSGKLLGTRASPAPHGRLSFSSDGTLLVVTAWDGTNFVMGIPKEK
jgi:WD40 repeat protein